MGSTGRGTVVFSHGKESGPWGTKITAMAGTARSLGHAVESLDYRGVDDAQARVDQLLAAAPSFEPPLMLVGSSMGGHVAAAAAERLRAHALFLLAPAFYMPGLEAATPPGISSPTAIVHGWHDDVVPVEHSIRWAREYRATLHVLDSGHRLDDRVGEICRLFADFLTAHGGRH